MKDEIEARCDECVSLGVECVKGYLAQQIECDVCGDKFTLVKAGCNEHEPYCASCGSKSVTIDGD